MKYKINKKIIPCRSDKDILRILIKFSIRWINTDLSNTFRVVTKTANISFQSGDHFAGGYIIPVDIPSDAKIVVIEPQLYGHVLRIHCGKHDTNWYYDYYNSSGAMNNVMCYIYIFV